MPLTSFPQHVLAASPGSQWHTRGPSSPCSCGEPLWSCAEAHFSWLYLCCPGEQELSCPKSICGCAWPPQLDDAPFTPGLLLPTQCVFPYFAHAHPWLSSVPDTASSPWERTGSCLPGLEPCSIVPDSAGSGKVFLALGSVFFHTGSLTRIKRAIKGFVLLQYKLQPTPSSCPVPLIKSVYVKCCEPKQSLIAK